MGEGTRIEIASRSFSDWITTESLQKWTWAKFRGLRSLPVSTSSPDNSFSDLAEHILGLVLFGYDVFYDALHDAYVEVLQDPSLHHFSFFTSDWNKEIQKMFGLLIRFTRRSIKVSLKRFFVNIFNFRSLIF